MQVTKEFLQQRIEGMQGQLEKAVEQVGKLRGAVMDCEQLMDYLDAPEEPVLTLDELKEELGAESIEVIESEVPCEDPDNCVGCGDCI